MRCVEVTLQSAPEDSDTLNSESESESDEAQEQQMVSVRFSEEGVLGIALDEELVVTAIDESGPAASSQQVEVGMVLASVDGPNQQHMRVSPALSLDHTMEIVRVSDVHCSRTTQMTLHVVTYDSHVICLFGAFCVPPRQREGH